MRAEGNAVPTGTHHRPLGDEARLTLESRTPILLFGKKKQILELEYDLQVAVATLYGAWYATSRFTQSLGKAVHVSREEAQCQKWSLKEVSTMYP